MSVDDPEIAAMAEMARTLKPFDAPARRRMLAWLSQWAFVNAPPGPEKHEWAAAGGKARAASLTPGRRTAIASAAAKARWKKTADGKDPPA